MKKITESAFAAEYERLTKALAREQNRTTLFKNILTASLEALPSFRPQKQRRPKHRHSDEESAVLCLSDIHGYESVTSFDTAGGNTYNEEVMQNRLRYVPLAVQRLTDLERTSKPIHELVIFLLGDIIAGESIYPGQAFQTLAPAIDQMTKTGRLLSEVIWDLSCNFSHVRLECIAGNHGRVAPRGLSHPRSNWDTLVYLLIKQSFVECQNVTVNIHESPIAHTTIQGRHVGFSHGANLAAGTSILPSTAAARAATRWPPILRKMLDLCIFGHFHRCGLMQVGSTDVVMNGSLVGGNLYSVERIGESNPPMQAFFGVHPRRLTWYYRIGFPTT